VAGEHKKEGRKMWEQILGMAINNGLMPALFVALLIYVLRDTAKREKKYQQMEEENRAIIARLTEGFKVVNELKNITESIHKDVTKLKQEKGS
jgi:activator of 2-hydroxyglutaryl-CoA dehydratase